MSATKIEWATDVWNPVTGCTKVSEGCRNCYAERMARRFEAVHEPAPGQCWDNPPTFGDVICHPDRLDQPLHWRKPRRVFVCSMGDLFHQDVPDEFIAAVFGVMAACPHHTFIVLTKRPGRMLEWFCWLKEMAEQTAYVNREPMRDFWTMHVMMSCARNYGSSVGGCKVVFPLPNVVGMVSVEDQPTADIRVPLLLKAPFARRGVSVEPMLGHVDFDRVPVVAAPGFFGGALRWHHRGKCHADDQIPYPILDWVICGGESGPGARPMHPDWARSLRDQCAAAQVPFFFKQWGEWTHRYTWRQGLRCDDVASGAGDSFRMARVGKKAAGRELDGRTWDEFPEVAR